MSVRLRLPVQPVACLCALVHVRLQVRVWQPGHLYLCEFTLHWLHSLPAGSCCVRCSCVMLEGGFHISPLESFETFVAMVAKLLRGMQVLACVIMLRTG